MRHERSEFAREQKIAIYNRYWVDSGYEEINQVKCYITQPGHVSKITVRSTSSQHISDTKKVHWVKYCITARPQFEEITLQSTRSENIPDTKS